MALSNADLARIQAVVKYLQFGTTGKFLDDIAADQLTKILGIPLDDLRDQPIPAILTALVQQAGGVTPAPGPSLPFSWAPAGVDLTQTMGYFAFNGLPGVTSLSFNFSSYAGGVDIESTDALLTVDFPNIVDWDPGDIGHYGWDFISNSALISITAPLLKTFNTGMDVEDNPSLVTYDTPSLVSVTGGVQMKNCIAITSLAFPNLVSVGSVFRFSGNTLLASVSIPSFVPGNGNSVDFTGCALTETSVDHILARCVANLAFVSGVVLLAGGTNSAPSSIAPGSDYDILTTRGVTVAVNP